MTLFPDHRASDHGDWWHPQSSRGDSWESHLDPKSPKSSRTRWSRSQMAQMASRGWNSNASLLRRKKTGGKNLEEKILLWWWLDVINYCFFWLGLLNLSWAGKSIWKRAADIQIFQIQKKPSLSNVSLGPLDIQRRHDFFRPSNFQGCAHRPKSHETIALSDLSQLTSRKTPGEFFIRPKKWGFSWRYPAKTNTEKSYYFYLFFQCVVTKINRLT